MSSTSNLSTTIGILGGGQLGRMLAVAASRLGLNTHVFAPDANPIAGQVANHVTQAEYTDEAALRDFAKSVDVVTFEFENIPARALDVIEEHCVVLPRRNALSISQDRVVEKNFLTEIGLTTTPYANVENAADLNEAVSLLGTPSILKTRQLGYDGKGQVYLTQPDQAADAWQSLGEVPCILEGVVDFRCEVSVIGARSQAGQLVCFDPGENVHRSGILRTTTVPSSISESERTNAVSIAGRILGALDYVGVMGVELFVDRQGNLLVNEIAPRVHNSGHWTQNGCVIDQFEQHVRAVAGWPLGDGSRHSDVVMTNLIGDDVLDVAAYRSDPGSGVHLYGKSAVSPGRKMGHINKVLGPATT